MNKLITTAIFVLGMVTIWAQAPQKMTYQAVIRNGSDAIISNTSIGMQISILQSSPTGIAVYIETHAPTTNINGLATVEVGNGTPVAGSFSGIDWSAGPYYLKTDTDPTGGTVYTISGTSELLSVPYALYSGSSFSGDYNDLTNQPTIPTTTSQLTNNSGFITSPNDADSDPTNEIQTLQLVSQNLTISGGNTVVLPSGGANTLDQAYDQGGAGAGRIITVDAGEVELTTATPSGIALRTTNTNTGVGIIAATTNSANGFSAIQATTNSSSNLTSAVVGNSTGAANGISGQVQSTATGSAGVYGNNLRTNGGYGTYGIGYNGTVGETNYQLGFGLYGRNYDAIGPLGNAVGTYGLGYVGVWGDQNGLGGPAIYANGELAASGFKSFCIDHPSDPENKYLKHFSVESDEVLNMYRGTVEFDQNGEVTITLPDYVELVNINYSYTLTPVGGFAPLYIKEEIIDGKFVIAGGDPSMKVSWVVYGERNDPYAQQRSERKSVEVEKESWNKGKYLMPDLYGQPNDKKIVQPLEERTQEPIKLMRD